MDFLTKILTARAGQTHIFSVGQAGFIIKSKSGQLLGIDLYLSDCVERLEGHIGYKRMLPKILSAFDLELDAVITTHFHWDHYDFDAVPALLANGRTKLFAATDCKELVERAGLKQDNICFVQPAQTYSCGDFTLHFINCDHGSGAPLAVGVIVEVDGKRILEVGDSCLRLDRKEEYLSKGALDVMIAPINGAYGNLNEEECAQLSGALKPKLTIPCHYGMFASHGGNPGRFYDVMTSHYGNNAFCIMALGEGIIL